jgi:hypothetical protein
MEKITKPKLVFFQWRYEDAAKFYALHKLQHIKCLSEFFEVIAINKDCDYQEICDKYQPDITLFESGITAAPCHRLIQNTSAYPEIPKLGFYNGDPFCGCRAAFLSDMEHWGIETFFTLSIPLAEYMPEIAENIFVWPNFIDPEIYHDYGESKLIPVLFTGSHSSLYPWRQRVQKIVSQYYPSLISPHLGYEQQTASRMIYGEQYARMINASWFVPSCGTMAKEVVRKHFEIPACKSCLITEKTPALEAAGFVDMQNCVFADETDVLDKIDYLFQNPEELERITNAGYQLVHSQHTYKQRDQILQWFHLNKRLKPGQRIVQKNPFGPLTVVESSSGIQNSHIISNGLDRVLLHQGDEKLWAGQYDEAEALYLGCLNYKDYMPEPKLRLAICNLYKGNAAAAIHWIVQPLQWTLVNSKALDPDPVEWAYLIIALLCQGKLNEASKRANQFPSLCHPELERTRWIINVLENPREQIALPNSDLSKCRISVQQLPNRSLNEWIGHVCMMLKACKQSRFAETLINAVSSEDQLFKKQTNPSGGVTSFLMKHLKKNIKITQKKLSNIFDNLINSDPKIRIKMYNLSITAEPFHITLITRITSKLKIRTLQYLSRLETLFGFFLPYPLSAISNDEFISAIQKLIKEENLKTALVIGASAGEEITEAFLAGIQENQNKPTAFCMNLSTPKFLKLQRRLIYDSFVRCYDVSSNSLENLPDKKEFVAFNDPLQTELTDLNDYSSELVLDWLYQDIEYLQKLRITDNAIKTIKQENQIDCFDMVLIDSSEFDGIAELDTVYGAKFLLFNDINTLQNYNNLRRLFADPGYTLVAQNTSLPNSYAIFQKVNNKVICQFSTSTEQTL